MRRLFRFFGLGLEVVLLILFAVGYAARYLPPRTFWWTEFAAIGLPYLAMALVATTLLVVLLRYRSLVALHFVALVLIAVRFVPAAWFQPASDPGEQSPFTLLTYNLPRWTGLSDEAMRDSLQSLVGHANPELIALQEVSLTYRPQKTPQVVARPYLQTLLDSAGYGVVAPHTNQQTVSTSLPVLGRVPLVRQSKMVLRHDDRSYPPTHVIRTLFRWRGRLAAHYNLHLRSFGDRKPWHDDSVRSFRVGSWRSYLRQYRSAFLDRAREARQIKRMLDRESLPYIVSGDLNSTPHSWVYRHLTGDLTDAFKISGRGWGATYHARWPFVRIDFVLASPEWKPVKARVLNARVSDHRPLLAQLRWKDPPDEQQ